jgi:L-lysine 2,3-aminomutase
MEDGNALLHLLRDFDQEALLLVRTSCAVECFQC